MTVKQVRGVKILVLCGGRGRRMGDLARSIPKPLVEVQGRPLLCHKLKYYREQGFSNFILCIGYRGDQIRKAVSEWGVEAEISDAGETAGILQRLFKAHPTFSTPTIISYGDTFADLDLSDLLNTHIESGLLGTLVTAPIQNPFGLVEWDEENRVTTFREKPILNHYIGYLVLQPNAFDFLPKKLFELPDGEGLVKAFKILSATGELGVYKFKGLQVTINSSQELKTAERKLGDYFTLKEKEGMLTI